MFAKICDMAAFVLLLLIKVVKTVYIHNPFIALQSTFGSKRHSFFDQVNKAEATVGRFCLACFSSDFTAFSIAQWIKSSKSMLQ